MTEQILDMSAKKIAERVGTRKLSASEVASAFIERIEGKSCYKCYLYFK